MAVERLLPSAWDGPSALEQDARRLELYLTHRAALIDYATRILGERPRAEDLVQDAYFRFVPRRVNESVGPGDQPLPYLYRIVRNLAFDVMRRRRTEQRTDLEPEWWMLPTPALTPEQALIHRETLKRVDAALAEMAPRERLAVEMKRFRGCTLQEIADHFDVSVPTAHRLVRDGLLKIAAAISDAEA